MNIAKDMPRNLRGLYVRQAFANVKVAAQWPWELIRVKKVISAWSDLVDQTFFFSGLVQSFTLEVPHEHHTCADVSLGLASLR